MSAATRQFNVEVTRAISRQVERERQRIINAVVAKFGLERGEVEKTVTGRFPGSLNEAKA